MVHGIEPFPPIGEEGRVAILEHVEKVLFELRHLAAAAQAQDLAYFIDMARLSAGLGLREKRDVRTDPSPADVP